MRNIKESFENYTYLGNHENESNNLPGVAGTVLDGGGGGGACTVLLGT